MCPEVSHSSSRLYIVLFSQSALRFFGIVLSACPVTLYCSRYSPTTTKVFGCFVTAVSWSQMIALLSFFHNCHIGLWTLEDGYKPINFSEWYPYSSAPLFPVDSVIFWISNLTLLLSFLTTITLSNILESKHPTDLISPDLRSPCLISMSFHHIFSKVASVKPVLRIFYFCFGETCYHFSFFGLQFLDGFLFLL